MKIKRSIFSQLVDDISQPNISILLGPRQVGKTFLLEEIKHHLNKTKRQVRYFNLEFPDDLNFFSQSTADLFDFFKSHPNHIFLVDEFHYLKNASALFKAIYDLKYNIKIIASGSSSIEIHKHLKESLAGRQNIFRIYPLNLEEFKQSYDTLGNYFRFGGMPGLLHQKTEDKKIIYLQQIIETYLLKDIKSLVKEENLRSFNSLLYFLANHQGNVIPVSSMANEVSMTNRSIQRYLDIMEHTFTLFPLHSYATNFSNELKKSRKYYFYDLGIRNMLCKNFSDLESRDDVGILAESFVFLILKQQQMPNVDLNFWRTKEGHEVDFIWSKNRKPIPIEVKTSYKKDHIPKGMQLFLKRYPQSPLGIIFNQVGGESIKHSNTKILVLPWQEAQNINALLEQHINI